MSDLRFMLDKILLWERMPVFVTDQEGGEIYCDEEILDVSGWWKENRDLLEKIGPYLQSKKYRLYLEEGVFAYAAVADEKERQYCILGPVLMKEMFYGDIGRYRKLQEYLRPGFRLPVCTLERLIGCIQLLHFAVCHEQLDHARILEECSDFPAEYRVEEPELFQYELQSEEEEKIPLPYQVEQRWKAALKEGETVDMNYLDVMSRVGEMAKSSKKQMEYTVVVGITIAARTAIEGGVSPMKALRLADVYLQKLEQCKDELHMHSLNANAMEAFLEAVREAKQEGKNEPSYIRACKDYIIRHRTRHISLEDMAEELKINYSYLSRKFKETEGITIQQYVIREKVRAAANMIRYSDLSLTEIAIYLDFSSQSHMGSCFKKEYGMTPNEYRKKYSY